MELKDKLAALEKQRSEHYLQIAGKYRKMSKLKDNYSLDLLANHIGCMLGDINVISSKIDATRAQIAAAFAGGAPFPKTPYD